MGERGAREILRSAGSAAKGADGEQIIVAHGPKVGRVQRHEGLRATRSSHELDFKCVANVHVYNRAQVPTT
jgi:hypothetical protein